MTQLFDPDRIYYQVDAEDLFFVTPEVIKT